MKQFPGRTSPLPSPVRPGQPERINIMRHLLMHPAFPDLVADWAAEVDQRFDAAIWEVCANDNGSDTAADWADPLLTELAKLEIAATRLW